MDDTPLNEPRPGGSIEMAAASRVRTGPIIQANAERFELRDPFAEVTYHFKTAPEALAKAEHLGALRFVAIDDAGIRSPVSKVDGQWIRSDGRLLATSVARQPGRDAGLQPSAVSGAPQPDTAKPEIEAMRAARIATLEAALNQRYIVKRALLQLGDITLGQTEYRFRGDASKVAFTASAARLATDISNPSVARSMVDVAETLGWSAVRLSGNEEFKRLAWLEVTLRGVKALGYEPQREDLQLLQRERDARQMNRIEPADGARTAGLGTNAAADGKTTSARGASGHKAVLATLEAVLRSKQVPDRQREAVMAAASENLAHRQRTGQTVKVKVFDKSAPPARPVVVPAREVQRTRERAALVR